MSGTGRSSRQPARPAKTRGSCLLGVPLCRFLAPPVRAAGCLLTQERVCVVCGKTFQGTAKAKYCSRAHASQAFYHQQPTTTASRPLRASWRDCGRSRCVLVAFPARQGGRTPLSLRRQRHFDFGADRRPVKGLPGAAGTRHAPLRGRGADTQAASAVGSLAAAMQPTDKKHVLAYRDDAGSSSSAPPANLASSSST